MMGGQGCPTTCQWRSVSRGHIFRMEQLTKFLSALKWALCAGPVTFMGRIHPEWKSSTQSPARMVEAFQ